MMAWRNAITDLLKALRGFALALFWAAPFCAVPAAAADGFAIDQSGGYARLVFTPDPPGDITARLTENVLIIGFSRPTTIQPAALKKALPGFVVEARIDEDGKTLRLALTRTVRLQQGRAGNQIAIDLVPRTMANNPPPFAPPKPVKQQLFDPKNPPEVKVRVGRYRNFTRLVFDWPKRVPYKVKAEKGRVTLRFDAPGTLDFSVVKRIAPPWVKPEGWRIDDGKLVAELSSDSDSGYHDFYDANNIVIDILAPKTDVDSYNPPGAAKPKVTAMAGAESESAPGPSGLSKQQETAIHTTAAQLNGVSLTGDPQAKSGKPEKPKQDKLTVEARKTKDGYDLAVAGMAARGAAVFVRGTTLWVAVQTATPFDAEAAQKALEPAATSADAAATDGISVLRIGFKQPMHAVAYAQGLDMQIKLSDKPLASPKPPQGILFSRGQDEFAHAILTASLPGAVRSVILNDPDAKDRIVVIPGALGHAVQKEHAFVEFSVLPTAAGIALLPFVDDLSLRIVSPRIVITRGVGLSLTQNTGPVLSLPTRTKGKNQTFLDFAKCGRLHDGDFRATERTLRAKAVRETNATARDAARLDLARFYLAHRFGAEALGLIKLLSDSPSVKNVQVAIMRAVAAYQLGRFREAHNVIVNAGLESDRHAALWLGLIRHKLGDHGGAFTAFEHAGSVVDDYAPCVQIEVRLAAADSALSLGKLDYAKAQVDRLPGGLTHHQAATADLIRARLAQSWGDGRRAANLYRAAEKQGNARTQVEAIYYRVDADLRGNNLKAKDAIAILERLRFRWRGDDLELKILTRLADLYFKEKRWREGLRTLSIAVKYFAGNDAAIRAQEEMRAVFVALFIKDGADKMKPNEALGLFFDFIDLTPIGPDGDDMIRRMADRLVKVDLLGPAADLLQYQVTKRLDGMARAQVATRLAMVQLLDHKPKDALATLISTNISTLPDDIRHQRLLLQARALSELKRYDEAIDLIAVDASPDTTRLRAEIYWQSGNWEVAGQKAEAILGNRWNGADPLDSDERQWAMRAAIAYSLADNEAALDRVRARFKTKMENTPDREAFAVLTQRTDMRGMAFRQAAAKVAAVDMLRSFIKDLQRPE